MQAKDMLDPRCNVIIPAEYIYGKGSTAARTLVTGLTEEISDIAFHECQNEPLLASTFYYYYIKWYVANYSEIKNTLKEWLNDFRSSSLDVLRRLNETYFCILSTYMMFLQYCYEKNFVLAEDAESLLYDFQDVLTSLIYAQNRIYEQSQKTTSSENVSILEHIRTLHMNKQFDMSCSADSYVEGVHDGFIRKDCLCLRPKKLVEKLSTLFNAISTSDITKELRSKNAITLDGEGNNKQVSAVGNKRFFHIPLAKLH